MNFQDEYDLVEAAPMKTLAPYVDRLDKLDRTILEARVSKSIAAEAIATEQVADLYLECGKDKVAAVYLQAAYDLYVTAGVTTKIDYLEYTHPHLFAAQPAPIAATSYFTDEFIATLSHEFRNPLNGILGMSEALLEEVFGTMNERQLNAVTTIDRSGGYLLAMINNMVDLSQLQAGKLALDLTQVSVAELCNSSTSYVQHHAIQKQIQLDTELPPQTGYIAVDLQRMRQVFIDLLERAIDATPVGGKVKLAVRIQPQQRETDRSTIQFSVIDTSKELSPTRNDNERVSQFAAELNTQGRGFGLMLVHPIVELHGGTIEYHSAIPGNGAATGRGSIVNICLPDTHSPSDLTTLSGSQAAPQLATSTQTFAPDLPELPLILIVEDNELNINTIASYLSAKGYRPIVAGDGAAAIELTQKFHPDLILMDIQMPGMDGLAAIASIRQQPDLAKSPIVALTALALEGDRAKCLAAGANEYLTKPVKLKQLNETIQHFLSLPDIDTISGDLWQ
ncbi:response regulator [Chamaesiphon sp. OTE_8_metabat_110]|uniref:hybrid sensor histidine kinase/response regulator n=1 Tax=Chamaesiphon sp. OTE_8_metabat_110 TaxID=2964696 RepID=UPI00286AAB6B|nr:response regulator [Chamaesiphon sp. OTE_8_metabat_110]